jgi:DNA-binding transcriptional LysR family regulator
MHAPRITLRQLQIFKAVAESGSTGTAADSVALSQSATSAALNELEAQLGHTLFDRVGKRLVLNDNGRALLPQALAVLDGAGGIESWAQERDRQYGRLRIGASTTIGNYLLPSMLAQFRDALPANVRDGWQAQVTIANTLAITRQVASFALDLGLIEGPCHEPELDALPWLEDQLVVVAAATDPLVSFGGGPVGIEVLRQATWLLREPGSGTREIINSALIPHLHQLRAGIEFGNAEAIKRGVACGLGISCLSHSVVADMVKAGELCILQTVLPPLTRRFYIVLHQKKQRTPGLLRLLETLQRSLADQMS